MKELIINEFDLSSIIDFWQEVERSGVSSNIDIYLNFESGDLLAFSRKPLELLVKMFAEDDCCKWSDLADDTGVSDEEFNALMDHNIHDTLNRVKKNQPPQLTNVQYSSNWYEDYTYVGVYSRFIDNN